MEGEMGGMLLIRQAVSMASFAISDAKNEPYGTAAMALAAIAGNDEIEATQQLDRMTAAILATKTENAFVRLRLAGYLQSDNGGQYD